MVLSKNWEAQEQEDTGGGQMGSELSIALPRRFSLQTCSGDYVCGAIQTWRIH